MKSLAHGREWLRAGASFVTPPPTFVVASTGDDVCPPRVRTDRRGCSSRPWLCCAIPEGTLGTTGLACSAFGPSLALRGSGGVALAVATRVMLLLAVAPMVSVIASTAPRALIPSAWRPKPRRRKEWPQRGGKDRRRRGGRGKGGGSMCARQTREDNGGTNA